MEGPLVATKLHVPAPRPELIDRARLIERLERAAQARLVLVSAPAGFGKSSLLTQWLSAVAGRGDWVAWLALDETDDRPGSFWPHLVDAVETAVPGFGAGLLDLLEASGPPTQGTLASLINELAALSGGVASGTRRLPPHRRPGHSRGRHLPAGAPPGPGAAADHHPCRPAAAASAAPRTRRPG